jgi:hypothetical protein
LLLLPTQIRQLHSSSTTTSVPAESLQTSLLPSVAASSDNNEDVSCIHVITSPKTLTQIHNLFSQLSPDVLVDFLRGVPREKITQLVNRGADSQFTDIAQAWLHRFDRNVHLHYLKLEIDHSRAADGTLSKQPTIYTSYEETNPDGQLTDFTLGLPIPQVQLPDNITGFEYIDIWSISLGLWDIFPGI